MTVVFICKAYNCIHNEDGCELENIVIDGSYCCQEYIPKNKEED